MDKGQHIRSVGAKTKLEYLQHHTKTVAALNKKGEYEIMPTSRCERGEVVYVIQPDDSFLKTENTLYQTF